MMDDQTQITRERLETSKERAIVFREWGYFSLVVLIGLMLIWALWSWRQTNLMVGATNAKIDGLLDRLGNKIEVLDTERVNALLEKASSRIDDLGKTQEQLTGLIADTRGNTNRLTNAAMARINELSENLSSLKGITDEARVQVKQNGDATAKTVASLDTFIKDTDTRISKLLDDGSLMIETANPKLQDLLAHADAVVVTADGTIKAYEPVGVNLAGITSDLNAMTTDSKNKLHEILWPAPKHGWARAGQLATYLLRPVFEGARVYYTLSALPVRITQPIPILK